MRLILPNDEGRLFTDKQFPTAISHEEAFSLCQDYPPSVHAVSWQQLMDLFNGPECQLAGYQRKQAWTEKKAAKMMKRLFEGDVIPSVFTLHAVVDVHNGERILSYEIVDGQQRITNAISIRYGTDLYNSSGDSMIVRRVAINPITREFASGSAKRGKEWLEVTPIFGENRKLAEAEYFERNKFDTANFKTAKNNIQKLSQVFHQRAIVQIVSEEVKERQIFEAYCDINTGSKPANELDICMGALKVYHPELHKMINEFASELRDPKEIDWILSLGANLKDYPYVPDAYDLLTAVIYRAFKTSNFGESTVKKIKDVTNRVPLEDAVVDVTNEEFFTGFNSITHTVSMFEGKNHKNFAYWLFMLYRTQADPLELEELEWLIQTWMLTINMQSKDNRVADIAPSMKAFLSEDSSDEVTYDLQKAIRKITEAYIGTDLAVHFTSTLEAMLVDAKKGSRFHHLEKARLAIEGIPPLFSNGDSTKKPHDDHVRPTSKLTGKKKKEQDSVANMVVMDASANREKSDYTITQFIETRFADNPEEGWEQAELHCITPAIAKLSDYGEFRIARAKLLVQAFRKTYEKLVDGLPTVCETGQIPFASLADIIVGT